MRNHGPFTIGGDAARRGQGRRDVEDVARTVHIARQLGDARRRSRRTTIDRLYDRYQNVYGQPPSRREPTAGRGADMTPAIATTLDRYEVWFLTGSQTLYGEETLRQVAEQSQEVARRGLHGGCRSRVVWKPVLTDADGDPPARARRERPTTRCIGVIAWMHTFSPAKMWIAGLDALRKPLLHLHTQANVELPWADIDFDFMNLNQAAHGDREFGYIQTRLGVAAQDRRRPRLRPARCTRAGRGLAARRGRLGGRRGRCKLARFGDNMRYVAVTEGDKTEAELRFGVQVNTWGVNDLVAAVDAAADADVDALVAEYVDLYDVAPELLPGGDRHESLRDGAAHRARPARRSSRTAASARSPPTSRTSAALRQLPGLAVQRLMADGYGFGAEGDWKTAILVRVANVMGAGLPGGASLMEDYTYDLVPGAGADPRRAHARGLPRRSPRPRPSLEIHPLGIGGKDDPVRLVFTADPGPGRRRRAVRPARPLPAGRQRRRERRGAGPAAACRSAAPSGSPRPTSPPPPPAGSPPGRRTTR